MEDSQRRKRPRCSICGSRRFQRDHASGSVLCDQGHVQATATQEAAPGELRAGARLTQQASRNKRHGGGRKRRDDKPPPRDAHQGATAHFLMMQAYQILLRRQIAALRKVFGFPAELELVARELWGLYVSLLAIEPVPLQTDADLEIRTLASQAKEAEAQAPDMAVDDEEDSDDDARSTVFLSGTQQDEKTARTKKWLNPSQKGWQTMRPQFTLVICYLSLITLRYPLMVIDLLHWVQDRSLPYLQAYDLMPEEIRRRLILNPHMMSEPAVPRVADDPEDKGPGLSLLATDAMSVHIARFIEMYSSKFGVQFPNLNMPPMLWRCVKSFALSPMMYERTKRLMALAGVDLTRKPFKSNRDNTGSLYAPDARALPPEVYLVCAIILNIRLLWGTDEEQRMPFDAFDPLAASVPRTDLLDAIEQVEAIENKHDNRTMWRKAVHQLDDEEVDRYLDYLQDMMPQVSKPIKHKKTVERIFPLQKMSGRTSPESPSEGINDCLAKLYATAEPLDIPEDVGTTRKGSRVLSYTQYNAKKDMDSNGELPESYQRLLGRAERMIGVPRAILFRVIEHMEVALFKAK